MTLKILMDVERYGLLIPIFPYSKEKIEITSKREREYISVRKTINEKLV